MALRQVLGAVGTVVGAYFGYPQLGYAIGSAIGNAVDPQVIKGPAIGDIPNQSSQEGLPRPMVFALSAPMPGNIIATGPPKIKKKRSSGKGGPKVETESVFRTYGIGVCEGPITRFVRVWRNGELVYDASAQSETNYELPTGVDIIKAALRIFFNNEKFAEKVTFHLGTYDQDADPALEVIFGVGTTPAHRGTAYMVVDNDDLTDLRGAIPQYMFQVERCEEGNTLPAFIAGRHADGATSSYMTSVDGLNWVLQSNPAMLPVHALCYAPELGLIVAVGHNSGASRVQTSPDGVTWTTRTPAANSHWNDVCWSPELGLLVAVSTTGGANSVMTSPDGISWTLRTTPNKVWNCCRWLASVGLFAAGGTPGLANQDGIMSSPDGITWTLRTVPLIGVFGFNSFRMAVSDSYFICSTRSEGKLMIGNGTAWSLVPAAPTILWDGQSNVAFGGGVLVATVPGPSGTKHMYSGDSGSTWFQTAALANGSEAVAYSSDLNMWVATGGNAINGQNAMASPDGTNWTNGSTPLLSSENEWDCVIALPQGGTGHCTYQLSSVILELATRVGMSTSLIDVSQLDQEVRGFTVINSYACTEALRALAQVFFFDQASYDGRVHFIPRGGDYEAIVTENDMLDDDSDIEQTKRADSIQVPRVLNLLYHDVLGGIAPDKQTSERSGDRRSTADMTIQTAVIFNADEAARVARINHKVLIEDQRAELIFSLPDSWIRLVPTSVVIVQWQGRSERVRVVKVDIQDGYQEYMALRDRQSAYTSDVQGIPAAPQQLPPDNVVGPTLIEPLDIHILRDTDDGVGLLYYIAVSGVSEAWQGALVELSYDGGANYIDAESTNVEATMGELVTALADHPQEFPDEVHTVSVRIETQNAELLETDLTGMLNGVNRAIIGDEIVNFANAVETTPGVWDLSYFLRGRKGTATAAHPIGTRFVLLDTFTPIPASILDIGRTLTFRATSFGTASDTGTVTSMVYTGRSQIEREVGYLTARREGVNAVVEWIGTGRLGAGAATAHGARFAGYRVTFDDGVLAPVIVDTMNQELTQDVSALGSPLTIGVVQMNDLTGAGPLTEVII